MKDNQVFFEEFERQLTIKIADPTYGKDTFRMRANLVKDFVGEVTVPCKFKVYKESFSSHIGKLAIYTFKMSCGRNKFIYSCSSSDTQEGYKKVIEDAVKEMDADLSCSPAFNYKWCNELLWVKEDFDMPDTWNEWYQDYLDNLID